MPIRIRLALIIFGLMVVLISVLALVYAFTPVDTLQAQATLAPTLFSPP